MDFKGKSFDFTLKSSPITEGQKNFEIIIHYFA